MCVVLCDLLTFSADQACSACSEVGCLQEAVGDLGLMTVPALMAMDAESYQLLDVRTQEERDVDHIGGVHIPLQVLAEHLDTLDKEAKWVIYCRSGVRSEQAGRMLCAHGFAHVSHLCGGIKAWHEACVALA